MSLPNPGMDFTAFDILTAAEMDDLVENIEALSAGSGLASNAINSTNVDWATSTGKVWWQEIGRTTLSVAGDVITVSGLPARKYLHIIISTASTGGTTGARLTFNGDTGSNYAYVQATTYGTGSSSSSQTGIPVEGNVGNWAHAITIDVFNISTSEKSVESMATALGTGASQPNGVTEVTGKWANTSSQISTVTITNPGTGDFAIGSEVIVLGHN